MKKVKKIENNAVEAYDVDGKKTILVKTKLYYEDNTVESFAVRDYSKESWGKIVKEKMENFDDFQQNYAAWERTKQIVNVVVPKPRYIVNDGDDDAIGDIVKCHHITIENFLDEKDEVKLCMVDIFDENNHIIDTFCTSKENLNEILVAKVDNITKIIAKGKIDNQVFYERNGAYTMTSDSHKELYVKVDFYIDDVNKQSYAILHKQMLDGSIVYEKTSIEFGESIVSDEDVENVTYNIRDERGSKTVTEKQFYNFYFGKETSEKEESTLFSTVRKVIFYKEKVTDPDNSKAAIIYSNGVIKYVSRQQGFKKASKLDDKDIVMNLLKTELDANLDTYVKEATESEKEKTTKDKKGFFSTIFNKIKKNKIAKRIVAGVVAAVMLITGGALIGKKLSKDKTEIPKNTDIVDSQIDKITNNKDNNSNENNKKVYYNNSFEITNNLKNKNQSRYSFLKDTGDYLVDYNITKAEKFKEQDSDKEAKLAHTFDEVAVQYLLYNDVSGNKINEIFGDMYLSFDDLFNEYMLGVSQDALAHNIQNSNLDKSKILVSEQAKEFYKKYDNMFTEMNSKEKASDKQKYMVLFYDTVREDFPELKSGELDEIDGYKLTVIEFIKAIEHMNISVDNGFTADETQFFTELEDVVVRDRISEIVTVNNADTIVGDNFGNKDYLPTVEDYEELIVSELEETDSYYIDEENRDVTIYDSYKNNINGIKEEAKKQEDKKDNKDNKDNKNKTTNTNNNSNNSSNNNYSSNGGNSSNYYPTNDGGLLTGPYEPQSTVVEDNSSVEDSDSNIYDDDSNSTVTVPAEDQQVAGSEASDQVISPEDMQLANDNASDQFIVEDNVADDYVAGEDVTSDYVPNDDYSGDYYGSDDGTLSLDSFFTTSNANDIPYSDETLGETVDQNSDLISQVKNNIVQNSTTVDDNTATVAAQDVVAGDENLQSLYDQYADMIVEMMGTDTPELEIDGKVYTIHL